MHFPFAIGPTRCRDDRADVRRQHARVVGAASRRGQPDPGSARRESDLHPRDIEILKPDGSDVFDQDADRSGRAADGPATSPSFRTDVARPAVIGIQRKKRSWREHWERNDD